jgi:hypothetical protein
MTRILTKLRVDEISSVDRGAGEGVKIVLMKRNEGDRPMVDKPHYWDRTHLLFNDVMAKYDDDEDDDDAAKLRDEDSDGGNEGKLSGKLKEMCAAMIRAVPTLSEAHALYFLLHHPAGRNLAEHLNNISKGETKMSQVDIFKLSNIASVVEVAKHIVAKGNTNEISEFDFTRMLQGHARLTKRDGESVGAAFERILTAPENAELRTAYRLTKGMASSEPTSVETGNTLVSDDSAKAVALLREMAEKQGRKKMFSPIQKTRRWLDELIPAHTVRM